MVPVAFALLAALAPTSEGEHVLSVGGEYVVSTEHGGGADVRWSLGLDDFWNLTVDLGWAQLVDETDAGDSHRIGGGVGVLYHLDAFAWVPYAIFAIEADGFIDPGTTRWGIGFQLGGGIDYRPSLRWSVGVYALWHGIVYGEAPRHTSYGLRLNRYF